MSVSYSPPPVACSTSCVNTRSSSGDSDSSSGVVNTSPRVMSRRDVGGAVGSHEDSWTMISLNRIRSLQPFEHLTCRCLITQPVTLEHLCSLLKGTLQLYATRCCFMYVWHARLSLLNWTGVHNTAAEGTYEEGHINLWSYNSLRRNTVRPFCSSTLCDRGNGLCCCFF